MENSGNPRVSQSQEDVQSMKLELEARREKESERRRKDAERKVEERLCKKLKLQSENKELELLRSFSNNLLEDYIKLKDKYKKLKEVNAKQRDLVAAVATQFVEQNLPNDVAFGGTAGMVGMPGMAGSGAHAPTFPMGNQQGLFNTAAMGGFDKDGLGAGGSSSQTAGWPGMVGMLGMAGSGAHAPMFPMGNQQGLFNAAAMGGFDKDGLGAGGSSSQTAGWPGMAGMVGTLGMAGSGAHGPMFPVGNQQGLFNAAAMGGFDKDGLGAGGSFSQTVGGPGMAGMVGMAGSGSHAPMLPIGIQQGLVNAAAKGGLGAGGSFSQTVGGPGMVGMAESGSHAPMLPMGNQQGLFNAAAMVGFDKDGLGSGGSSSKSALSDTDPFAQF